MSQCSYNNSNPTIIIALGVILGLVFIVQNKKVNNEEHFSMFNVKKFVKKINPTKFIKKIGKTFKTMFTKIGKFVAKILKKIGKTFTKLVSKGVKGVFKRLKTMIRKTIHKLSSKLKPFLTVLGGGLAISALGIFAGCFYYYFYMMPKTIQEEANNMEQNNLSLSVPLSTPIPDVSDSPIASQIGTIPSDFSSHIN